MELALQFGWGMMEHCRFLVRHWGGGQVILSPRDLGVEQLTSFASSLSDVGGTTLLDPQLYVPDCDHERLTAHSFWPRAADYWRQPAEMSRIIRELVRVNGEAGTEQIICPSPLISVVNDDSMQAVSVAIDELGRLGVHASRILATVALTSDAVRNEDRAEMLADAIESWGVAGIYLIAEHPNNEYLVTDPMWIARLLDIVAGARLANKSVIIGYCTHQMLIAAAAGATAIGSGTWINVRAFSGAKFSEPEEDAVSRRTRWYYAPHLFSEFKIPYLDVARSLGLLPQFETPPTMDGSFAAPLFSGVQPTSAEFPESTAFRHYLHCLRQQVAAARRDTFQETVREHEELLATAETGLEQLRRSNVTGQGRDFLEALPANRAALTLLKATRGPILRMEWQDL